jgi:hypothetical protein
LRWAKIGLASSQKLQANQIGWEKEKKERIRSLGVACIEGCFVKLLMNARFLDATHFSLTRNLLDSPVLQVKRTSQDFVYKKNRCDIELCSGFFGGS